VTLFLVVGLGVYLMRFLPLLAALRRRESPAPGGEDRSEGRRETVLRLAGTSIIAALLVTSLLPQPPEDGYPAHLALNLGALAPAVFVAARTGNLGLTVLAGVLSYWAISVVL
jgi:branched-subunit amino acid transport protein